METVTATVRELSESGRTPGKVFTLLRGCVGRSGVSKALKRLRDRFGTPKDGEHSRSQGRGTKTH